MILVVLSDFVEVIFVQLPDETGEVAMLEMLGKDRFREFLVLRTGSICSGRNTGFHCILQVPRNSLRLLPNARWIRRTGLRAF